MNKISISFNDKIIDLDESKLAKAKASIKSILSSTLSGHDATIKFDGVVYNIDSSKVADAVSKIEVILNQLEIGGETLNITDENAVLISEVNEFGGQTAVIN